ncbi:MAG: Hsp20/alpha crystallin family protein [Planctomycetota bacterium]|nr:Hsp20/alpha crystallin family protein [Planctomycetota bacterium]
MAIQRWDPQRDMIELQGRMNRLFDEALSHSVGSEPAERVGSNAWRPPLDLIEEPGRYLLRADLPGVGATDVEIEVEDGKLVLRGERRVDAGLSRENYLRVERPQGRFSVQITLPPSVQHNAIRATHRNGVIEVVLPKRKDETPSRIEVSSH